MQNIVNLSSYNIHLRLPNGRGSLYYNTFLKRDKEQESKSLHDNVNNEYPYPVVDRPIVNLLDTKVRAALEVIQNKNKEESVFIVDNEIAVILSTMTTKNINLLTYDISDKDFWLAGNDLTIGYFLNYHRK